MTAAWPDLRAGLTALFVKLSGIPAPDSAAVNETGQPWTMPGVSRLELSWRVASDRSLGRAELRSWYDGLAVIEGDTYVPPDGPALGGVVYEVELNRELVIEVKVENGQQDVGARDVADRVRTRMSLPSSQALYRALGLGLQGPGILRDVSGPDLASRQKSAYVIEFTFNGASSQADDPITTIEAFDWCLCPCGGGDGP